MLLLGGKQLQILSLPAHCCIDTIASAGVVEKGPLLDRTGIHLAVFAEMDGSLGKAVGLPTRIQSVHVGLVLLRAGPRVHDRRDDEAKDGDKQHYEGKNCRIAHASNLPPLAPALERPLESENSIIQRSGTAGV